MTYSKDKEKYNEPVDSCNTHRDPGICKGNAALVSSAISHMNTINCHSTRHAVSELMGNVEQGSVQPIVMK